MAKLLSKLRERGGSVPDLYQRLKDRAREREQNYDKQQRRLFEASVPTKPAEGGTTVSIVQNTDRALSDAVTEIAESRKDKPWWVWSQEASKAPDPGSKEAILLQALEALPDSAELLSSYALFLETTRKDIAKAEEFHQCAVGVAPPSAMSLSFYATFLKRSKEEITKAEEYYLRSLKLDPNDAYTLASYADLLEFRGDMEVAENYYSRAAAAKLRTRMLSGITQYFSRPFAKTWTKPKNTTSVPWRLSRGMCTLCGAMLSS
jgi:tetratricopeptide (TPR) repeat protein